jgi:hypothetical protein
MLEIRQSYCQAGFLPNARSYAFPQRFALFSWVHSSFDTLALHHRFTETWQL